MILVSITISFVLPGSFTDSLAAGLLAICPQSRIRNLATQWSPGSAPPNIYPSSFSISAASHSIKSTQLEPPSSQKGTFGASPPYHMVKAFINSFVIHHVHISKVRDLYLYGFDSSSTKGNKTVSLAFAKSPRFTAGHESPQSS